MNMDDWLLPEDVERRPEQERALGNIEGLKGEYDLLRLDLEKDLSDYSLLDVLFRPFVVPFREYGWPVLLGAGVLLFLLTILLSSTALGGNLLTRLTEFLGIENVAPSRGMVYTLSFLLAVTMAYFGGWLCAFRKLTDLRWPGFISVLVLSLFTLLFNLYTLLEGYIPFLASSVLTFGMWGGLAILFFRHRSRGRRDREMNVRGRRADPWEYEVYYGTAKAIVEREKDIIKRTQDVRLTQLDRMELEEIAAMNEIDLKDAQTQEMRRRMLLADQPPQLDEFDLLLGGRDDGKER